MTRGRPKGPPRKQDWSPRDLLLPRNKAVLRYQNEAWWDAIRAIRSSMHPYNFRLWLARRARARTSRTWIIRQLAWKDGIPPEKYPLLDPRCDFMLRTAEAVAGHVIQRLEKKP